MPKTKVKQPKVVEPFWKPLIETYLLWMENKLGSPVTFDKTVPRNMKAIVKKLREQANDKGIAWTKPTACMSLSVFLQFAWYYPFTTSSEKWFIPTANQYKEEILDQIHQYKESKKQNAIHEH